MARCVDCEADMLEVDSCVVEAFHRGPERFPLIRFGDERPRWRGARCGDCNAKRGGLHHLGCDIARCPDCGGQQISCGCVFDEWGEDEDEDEEIDARDRTEDERIERTVADAVAWVQWRNHDARP